MAYITNIGRSQWYLVPAALVFFAVALADWSRGGARAKARLSFVFGQAAYVFSSVALSGLFVNAIKVLFGRARPRLLDQVGAHYFDPLTLGYLNASFPSGHSTTVGAIVGILIDLVSALVAADRRAWPVLRRDPDRGPGALSVRRGRQALSSACSFRSAWRAGWPDAAWCSASRRGKSFRFRPAAPPRKSLLS